VAAYPEERELNCQPLRERGCDIEVWLTTLIICENRSRNDKKIHGLYMFQQKWNLFEIISNINRSWIDG